MIDKIYSHSSSRSTFQIFSRICLFALSVVGITAAGQANANSSNYASKALILESTSAEKPTPVLAEIGPFFGGGSLSNSDDIKSTSGFQFILKKHFEINRLVVLAPRLEFINNFISTSHKTTDDRSMSSYDNRSYGIGLEVATQPASNSNWNIYAAASLGQGKSKLSIKKSTNHSFTQFKTSGVPATYRSIELGSHIDFVGSNLGLNLALVSSAYNLDQSEVSGSIKKEERSPENNGILLSQQATTAELLGLENTLIQNTISLRIGLSMAL
jgi:hypothetical protein